MRKFVLAYILPNSTGFIFGRMFVEVEDWAGITQKDIERFEREQVAKANVSGPALIFSITELPQSRTEVPDQSSEPYLDPNAQWPGKGMLPFKPGTFT